MVNNVVVTVVGEQRSSREQKDVEPIELVTNGSLHEKDGKYYLKYDEYYEGLKKPVRNLLKFDENGLSLTKKGDVSSQMLFDLGEPTESFYSTPEGLIPMSILTEAYRMKKTEEGIGIAVVYVMDYGNECLSFNILRITIQ